MNAFQQTTTLLVLSTWMLDVSDLSLAGPSGVKPQTPDFTQGTETITHTPTIISMDDFFKSHRK